MGIARRSGAPPGSSQAIYDDLRRVRSRGGFSRAQPDDLLGVLGLARYGALPKELAFDAARSDLKAFLSDVVEAEIESGAASAGPVVAARSLLRLLLAERSARTNYERHRNEIGGPHGRNADYVRQEENALLELAARLFWTESHRTTYEEEPATEVTELSYKPHPAQLTAPLTVLRNLHRTFVEFAVEADHQNGPPWKVELTEEMSALIDEALYHLGAYEAMRRTFTWLSASWREHIGALEEGLWPTALSRDRADSNRLRRRVLDASSRAGQEVEIYLLLP